MRTETRGLLLGLLAVAAFSLTLPATRAALVGEIAATRRDLTSQVEVARKDLLARADGQATALQANAVQQIGNIRSLVDRRLGDTLAKDGSDAATWIILETIYASNITTCPWFDRSPQCLLDTDIVSVTWCHSQIRILDELFKQLEALVEKHQTETREALLEELLNDPTLNGEAAAAAAAAAAGPAKKKARQTRYSRVIDTPSVLSRRGATPPRVCRDALPKKRLRGIKYRAPRFTFFEMPLDTPRYMKMIGRAPDLPSWTPFGGNVINMLSF